MVDKTLHWDPELRENQKQLLDCLPEDKREFMAFTLRTGNVSCHYYREREAEPTQEDFEDWLTGLPESLANSIRKDGFEKSKTGLPLRRHAAERNDMGMDAYMTEALNPQDYARWSENKK